MKCTRNFLCINKHTPQEDVMEWLAQNYSYKTLLLYLDNAGLFKGRVVIHVQNADEFAEKYADRPFFLSQVKELRLRVSVVDIKDIPSEFKNEIGEVVKLSFDESQICYITNICNALGLKRRETHDYFIFDNSTTAQKIRKLFACDSRTIMRGHDLSKDYWHEILIINTDEEWDEIDPEGNGIIGLENVDKLILDVDPDEKSPFKPLLDSNISGLCEVFGFKNESTKKSDCEIPTSKPDGTRICSWRSGKRHYGFFHLFGETTVRTRTDYDVKEIRALVETLDGTMIWLDPMRIKFED